MKLNKKILTILIFLGLLFNETIANAQSNKQDGKVISLEQIIEIALKNNPNLKVAQFQTEQEMALQKASVDFPKTDFNLEYGQTNSDFDNDTRFNITQTFAFPTLYVNQAKLAKSKVKSGELNKDVVKNELIKQLTASYYQLWFLKSTQSLLRKQDSIYQRFAYAANLRFETGESNALERATANAEVADLQIRIQENEASVKNYQLLLQKLMNVSLTIEIVAEDLEMKRNILLTVSDTLNVERSPLVAFYQEQVTIAKNQKSVVVSKALPNITLGYFNQSFNGPGASSDGVATIFDSGDRFTGLQFGLAIPIWFRSHSAKIKAAKIHKMESEAKLEIINNAVNTQLNALLNKLDMNQKNISYYKQHALPQSELLLKQSQRGFKEGAIGYIEYVQGVNRGLEIQIKYLNFLNTYNQTLIELESINVIE